MYYVHIDPNEGMLGLERIELDQKRALPETQRERFRNRREKVPEIKSEVSSPAAG
jgi:hypothetical protein